MKKPTRNTSIDTLRGIAMVAMILNHTTAFYKTQPIAGVIWDYSLFAVPLFIFCSAYLFFTAAEKRQSHYDIFYFIKRTQRLLFPYYIFLGIFFVWLLAISPQTLSLQYIFENIFLVGGVGINWLVLLFLQVMIVMPLVDIWSRKNNKTLYIFSGLSVVFSSVLLFWKWPLNYLLIMWLPWSLVIVWTWFFIQWQEKKSRLVLLCMITVCAFLLSYLFLWLNNYSLLHYHNKYPPNIYHLTFGLVSTFILYYLTRWNIFSLFNLDKLLYFLSIHSYTIYFIHFFVISVVRQFSFVTQFDWMSFTAIIFVVTILLQRLANYCFTRIFALKRS